MEQNEIDSALNFSSVYSYISEDLINLEEKNEQEVKKVLRNYLKEVVCNTEKKKRRPTER